MGDRSRFPRYVAGTTHRAIFLIVTVHLLLRFAIAVPVLKHPDRSSQSDTLDYTAVASTLLHDHRYERYRGVPHTARPPLYSTFIAAHYVGSEDPRWIVLSQVLVDTGTLLLVFVLTRRLFRRPRFATLAAAVYAFSLPNAVYCSLLMSETLFTFVFLASIVLGVPHQRPRLTRKAPAPPSDSSEPDSSEPDSSESDSSEPDALGATRPSVTTAAVATAAWSGVLIGLATLIRPVGVLGLPALMIALQSFRARRFARAAAIAIGFAVIVLPWCVRNHTTADVFAISTIVNYDLLAHSAAALLAERNDVPEPEMRTQLLGHAEARAKDAELSMQSVMREDGLKLIAQAPFQYGWIHARDSMKSLLPPVRELLQIMDGAGGTQGTSAVLRKDGIQAAVRHFFGGGSWIRVVVPSLLWAGQLALALAGAVVCLRRRSLMIVAVLLLTPALLLIAPGPAAVPRFAVPAGPFLAILAAVGLDSGLRGLSRLNSRER